MWHRATEELRESGRLAVVGIVQEQHPARTRLYAQWQGIEWPILWDPLNVTGSAGIPRVTLLDERGAVIARRPDPRRIAELVGATASARAEEAPESAPPSPRRLLPLDGPDLAAGERLVWEALSAALRGEDLGDPIDVLEARVAERPEDAAAWFRLGVLRRMRHDSAGRRRGDFQRAVDAWGRALALNPRQYIWRRRIQQYGPLLDKPYPFYPWIDEALSAVRARGEQPVAVPRGLSDSERAPRRGRGGSDDAAPSPFVDAAAYDTALAERAGAPVAEGDAPFDVETVLVRDTDARRPVARLYVAVHGREGVRLGAADDALRVTFAPGGARPESWELVRGGGTAEPLGERWFEVDLRLPDGSGDAPTPGGVLRGDVVAVLAPRDGADRTRTVRRSFTVPLARETGE